MSLEIVLATGNAKKVVELERILADLDVALVPMSALGLEGAEETGDTFEANALIKARAVAASTGKLALADDSGLEVDVLDGAPGVHSSRYAGSDGDDAANNAKLVAALGAVGGALGGSPRTARFVCVAALVTPDGREWTTRGAMEGRVVLQPRGEHGFGYDPYFVSDGEDRTNAELSAHEKDARSHRGEAFRAMVPHVRALVSGDPS